MPTLPGFSVEGVVTSDAQGLCEMAVGSAPATASPYLHSLMNSTKHLSAFSAGEEPIVTIESDSSTIIVRRVETHTVALYCTAVAPADTPAEA